MSISLMEDPSVVRRVFEHIDRGTTDLAEETWREPVANYRSPERFAAELELVFRKRALAFCPSAALPEPGSFLARDAAGTPLVVVRDREGRVRAFRNACRHRGTKLADGVGCAKAFVCRYHGWTYGLDGSLLHVPHEHGFPGLDAETRGLVPVAAAERSGIVFVAQDPAGLTDGSLDPLPPLFSSAHRVIETNERETPVNWKVVVEGFLEGYHIRTTHPQTFYPVQFDNLNVVEHFGRNSRVTFPYRAIDKLREREPAEWRIEGKLTYVYHFFPNAMVATFPSMMFLIVVEPIAVDRSRLVTWRITDRDTEAAGSSADVKRASEFANQGGAEDQAVAFSIQEGLASGANEFFEFGRFEGAIVHLHRNLHALVGS